jgi:dTDP-4-amino-4,6-dideoxy-D-galactose acyltransferase
MNTNETSSSESCKMLQWDSDFFGRRIARIEAQRLDPPLIQEIYKWSKQNAVDCLYFAADLSHPPTIRLAEDHGFHLMEVRVTFERKLRDWQPGPIPRTYLDVLIREAQPEDVPAMQAIAGTSYTTTHFIVDPRFPPEQGRAFYETWIKNSCAGYEDMVLAAEADGEVIGFLTARFLPENREDIRPECQLMLIGIKSRSRRKGIGLEMLRSGIDWLVRRGGSERVTGVVQAQNTPIVRSLERLGFASCSAQLFYHKWFTDYDEPA